jgi:signal peptidase I
MAEATFRKSTFREYFESLVVAVILALFVRTFAFQAFKIPTGSMEPNLLVGDHLLVNKFVFAPTVNGVENALLPMRAVERGDVLVFKFPEEPERDFIKRVIGLPGETLELRDQIIHINGAPLVEPYAHYQLPPAGPNGSIGEGSDVRRRYGPITIPAGHYFMMGDNRDDSQDSRYWGFLPATYVKGRAVHLLVLRRARGHALGEAPAPDSLRTGGRTTPRPQAPKTSGPQDLKTSRPQDLRTSSPQNRSRSASRSVRGSVGWVWMSSTPVSGSSCSRDV